MNENIKYKEENTKRSEMRCMSDRGTEHNDEEENHTVRNPADIYRINRNRQLTMKNWHRVMWGKMLWALFLPQVTRLCCQKWESWFCRGPLGRR